MFQANSAVRHFSPQFFLAIQDSKETLRQTEIWFPLSKDLLKHCPLASYSR